MFLANSSIFTDNGIEIVADKARSDQSHSRGAHRTQWPKKNYCFWASKRIVVGTLLFSCALRAIVGHSSFCSWGSTCEWLSMYGKKLPVKQKMWLQLTVDMLGFLEKKKGCLCRFKFMLLFLFLFVCQGIKYSFWFWMQIYKCMV